MPMGIEGTENDITVKIIYLWTANKAGAEWKSHFYETITAIIFFFQKLLKWRKGGETCKQKHTEGKANK